MACKCALLCTPNVTTQQNRFTTGSSYPESPLPQALTTCLRFRQRSRLTRVARTNCKYTANKLPPPSYVFQNSCPRINKEPLALPETDHGELPSSAEQSMTIDGTADN